MWFIRKKPEVIIPMKKIIHITITFYGDLSPLNFNRTYEENDKISYVLAFYDFYNWFFTRINSERYVFGYKEGSYIFFRKDIARVSFLETIEPGKSK